jgi:hypothetical protein
MSKNICTLNELYYQTKFSVFLTFRSIWKASPTNYGYSHKDWK